MKTSEIKIAEHDNLKKIVQQLEMCNYECEGGVLKNNVAFISLKRMSETTFSSDRAMDGWFDTPIVVEKTAEIIRKLEQEEVSTVEAMEIAYRIKRHFQKKM